MISRLASFPGHEGDGNTAWEWGYEVTYLVLHAPGFKRLNLSGSASSTIPYRSNQPIRIESTSSPDLLCLQFLITYSIILNNENLEVGIEVHVHLMWSFLRQSVQYLSADVVDVHLVLLGIILDLNNSHTGWGRWMFNNVTINASHCWTQG